MEARSRHAFVVAADPPVEHLRPRVRRALLGTPDDSAPLRWLRAHSASIGLTVLFALTILLVAIRV